MSSSAAIDYMNAYTPSLFYYRLFNVFSFLSFKSSLYFKCNNISDGERQSASLNATGFLPTLDNPNINNLVGVTRAPPVFISPEVHGPIAKLNSNNVLNGKGRAIF